VGNFIEASTSDNYRQCLAPISGSIEETDKSPIAAVWREINEETTLTPANLNLFRRGKPYSFTDEKVGRVWTVHPFAFSLKSKDDEKRIQLDWEHEGFSWHDPLKVTDDGSLQGVPFLAKSLRRVWFDMDLGKARGRILRRGLESLQKDEVSAARQLASNALNIFRHLVTEIPGEDAETWRYNARSAAWHLWNNGCGSMDAVILNTLVRGLRLIDDEVERTKGGIIPQDSLARISKHLLELEQKRDEAPERIWQSLKPMLEDLARNSSEPVKVVTLGASSTVAWCLQRALRVGGLSLDIRVVESTPLFEGVSMAAELAEFSHGSLAATSGSRITVYPDESAADASKDADILLLGADLIAGDGAVSNKLGSMLAVLRARCVSSKIKVVVLAELEKILAVPEPTNEEENDMLELIKGRVLGNVPGDEATFEMEPAVAQRSAARNVEFEWVDPGLVDVYISEDTIRGTEDIIRQADSSRAEVERLFAESETVV
jgi:translation initiation factor 2B subunit (eIF-2B alpha/beta/delta family)